MGTSLAVREQMAIDNPAGLGNKNAIAAVRDRIMTMMPGALEAPADVVWAAAQLAVAYRLDPFNGELYIMKIGSKKVNGQWVDDYRAHVGIKGLRKKAREQALFMTKFRDLTPDEVKAARRGEYDAGDVGVLCEVYRMDIAQQCARLGIPYEPFRATGFWRVKAKKKQDGWEPDNIPNTWTAHDVAEKRAEINALKRAYDLNIDVADPASVDDDETIEVVGRRIHQIEMDQKPVHRIEAVREDDGDLLWHTDAPAAEYASADVEMDALFGDDSAEDVTPKQVDILADPNVHDAVKDLVLSLRNLEKPGARHATPKQHNYAVGIVDGICGKGSHRAVFGAIFNREVSGDAPIAEAAAQQIFKKLSETKSVKGDDGKWVRVENPEYDAQDVAILYEVGKWAGAVGQ